MRVGDGNRGDHEVVPAEGSSFPVKLHAPIPDGWPPGRDFEDAWPAVGEAMRDRPRPGFDVLIHCRGGPGRAGAVAARLLVEPGASPEEAIRRVREARSAYAIEIAAQEAHVAQCSLQAPCVPPQAAAGSKSWNSYRNFANRVRRRSRYIRTPEDDEFLREVLRTSKDRIRDVPDGAKLWRARPRPGDLLPTPRAGLREVPTRSAHRLPAASFRQSG